MTAGAEHLMPPGRRQAIEFAIRSTGRRSSTSERARAGSPDGRQKQAPLIILILLILAAPLLPGCAVPPPAAPQALSERQTATIPASPGLMTQVPYRKAQGGYPSLAPMLARITPAVVNVSVVSEVPVEDHPFLRDPAFRRFLETFDVPVPPQGGGTERRRSVGSGFIVDGASGYVLTNAHVIEDATEITVTLKNRRNFRARLIGRDRGSDTALLQIPAISISGLDFGDSDQLEVGDFVIVIGNPFGLGQTVTSGIVSAVGRTGIAGDQLGDLIQTDASINPGNSGGPLINLAGEVVGINSALLGPAGGNVGIGFAVPSNRVKQALNRIIAAARSHRR